MILRSVLVSTELHETKFLTPFVSSWGGSLCLLVKVIVELEFGFINSVDKANL